MSDLPGPRTIAARALLTRAPGGRQTMRGVAVAELSKLLARVEQEATEPYRAELRWALDELDRRGAGETAEVALRLAAARAVLEHS